MSTTTSQPTSTQTEAWMRGPIEGIPPLLMPVAHALMQARDERERIASSIPPEHVWLRPGGAGSIGFHIRHLGAALDRLFTYARGERLTEAQRAELAAENEPGSPPATLEALVHQTTAHIDRALDQLRNTSAAQLLDFRGIGRAQLPSN